MNTKIWKIKKIIRKKWANQKVFDESLAPLKI